MKNNKGITLTSLVLYVLSFLMICGMIATITTFFYNNEKVLADEATDSVEWDIFNAYMLKECSIKGNDLNIVVTPQTVEFKFDKTKNTITYDRTNYKGLVLKKNSEENLEKFFPLTSPTINRRQAISITVYDEINPSGRILSASDNEKVENKFSVSVSFEDRSYSQTYYLTK